VRERYGVDPGLVPDFIALRGDPSDKLPGARGVGAKRAAVLLNQFGSLEAILAGGQFADQAEHLKLYKKLATMDASAPLHAIPDRHPLWGNASRLAREWGLDRLARRLDELATQATG
jgi:DNA polymerase-1